MLRSTFRALILVLAVVACSAGDDDRPAGPGLEAGSDAGSCSGKSSATSGQPCGGGCYTCCRTGDWSAATILRCDQNKPVCAKGYFADPYGCEHAPASGGFDAGGSDATADADASE